MSLSRSNFDHSICSASSQFNATEPRRRCPRVNLFVVRKVNLSLNDAVAIPIRPDALLPSVFVFALHAGHVIAFPKHCIQSVEDAIRSLRPHLPETIELTLSLDKIHLSNDAERLSSRGPHATAITRKLSMRSSLTRLACNDLFGGALGLMVCPLHVGLSQRIVT